jgi:hypothetical protein
MYYANTSYMSEAVAYYADTSYMGEVDLAHVSKGFSEKVVSFIPMKLKARNATREYREAIQRYFFAPHFTDSPDHAGWHGDWYFDVPAWDVEIEFHLSSDTKDLDNLAKPILDAFNGLLWDDDRKVSRLKLIKRMSPHEGFSISCTPCVPPK